MKYSNEELYYALVEAETGCYINKFIRTSIANSFFSGYGPIQIRGGNYSIIQKIIDNKTNIKINQPEEEYINKFLITSKYNKSNKITKQNVKYYKIISLKIIDYIYKKNNYNINDFIKEWICGEINFNIDKELFESCYYKRFINFLNNPNRSILIKINDLILSSGKILIQNEDNLIGKVTDNLANLKGCSYYIRIIKRRSLYSAWHCHNVYKDKILYSSFNENLQKIQSNVLDIFNKINEKPYLNYEDDIKKILTSIIPTKEKYVKHLKEGNLVGLFFKKSTYHKDALFEGAINRTIFQRIKLGETLSSFSVKNNCSLDIIKNINNIKDIDAIKEGDQVIIPCQEDDYYYGDGRFVKTNNETWNPSHLGKNLIFSPKNIYNNISFAFNTHIGIVAKVGIHIMILHYVGNTIHLTPINNLAPNFHILWVME